MKEHNPINQEYVGPVSPKSQVTLPAPPEASSTVDPTVLDAYRTSVREYYIYLENRLKHRQKVFHWQYYSSIVIFFVVIILVGTGIYFAAVQFHHGLKQGGDEKETITQLEATTSGIKISSPVLGVLILIISLVFFYLYLAFVYPINELL
ncbi:hypothetical protein JWZ98_22450 [Methylomonas sp. EFPC1]|uniref:hypothetical protein n=1 Tax=Methylomonas sp. EFPC1 TaxID=2812647 RepID=UPI001967F4AF|nr:hypothetical protein [Methylomonas sp. EFPC1]QSB01356.1 hypothetical protein JWZ98_22450 [Methylomonas sp. EFPC1]